MTKVRRHETGRVLIEKMGIEPSAWRRVPASVAARYDNQWGPVEELVLHLALLPVGLIGYLADHPRGYFIIGDRTYYEPGTCEVQGKWLSNVVHLAIADVASSFTCLCITAALVDHLLGCNGERDGLWLSDGGGISPTLVQLGEQIRRLHELGYGVDVAARHSRHVYLAHSLAWYILDRRRLNIEDPLMERLLKRSLMNERFWRDLPAPAEQLDADR